MSKHKTPEQKLHISTKAAARVKKSSQKFLAKARRPETIPPKGTNADNQFH